MKNILISHFYNEEYLLPFWLNHHKTMFEHAIMIDYESTDKSVEIIKSICPSWEIVKSKNKYFSAKDIDIEVHEYESQFENGIFRICLNTTEFLLCKNNIFEFSNQKIQYLIPSFTMVDCLEDKNMDLKSEISLIKQRTFGIHYNKNFSYRRARSLHNHKLDEYPLGRHFEFYNTSDIVICWYGFSPFNKFTIQRKLQIQNKIPHSDIEKKWGFQHITNQEKLESEFLLFNTQSEELIDEMERIIGQQYE